MAASASLQVTITEEKECVWCGEPKLKTEFHARHAKCKPCHRKSMRENYWRILRHKKSRDEANSRSSQLLKSLKLRPTL